MAFDRSRPNRSFGFFWRIRWFGSRPATLLADLRDSISGPALENPMRMLLLLVLTASISFAQETRRTTIRPSPNPADDTKANSDQVPDVYAVTGHFDRIVVLRLKYKTDLLAGLQKMVKQENIRNGIILSAVGSVRGYQFHTVSNRTLPSQDTFVKNPTQPADLVSMNGYVIDGRLHPHMTLATPDKVIAGHLEPGTEVFTFAIVTIGVMNDADLRRVDDKNYR
jgi:predicted DNA-binding protein with PD1-like motif